MRQPVFLLLFTSIKFLLEWIPASVNILANLYNKQCIINNFNLAHQSMHTYVLAQFPLRKKKRVGFGRCLITPRFSLFCSWSLVGHRHANASNNSCITDTRQHEQYSIPLKIMALLLRKKGSLTFLLLQKPW